MSNPGTDHYLPRRTGRSVFVPLRGLRYHATVWGDDSLVTAQRPVLVMMHGWMDIGTSFQFVVDALANDRMVVAADWRGFGRSAMPPVDCYWFPDYLGDLDALLRAPELGLSADSQVDLLGHSMGGNVVMSYGGVRPEKVRRLINLEGFGLPDGKSETAPQRMAKWLDELLQPTYLRSYADLSSVATRLQQNNPRLAAEHAHWLAPHWAESRDDGRWHVRGDPAHRRINPVLFRREEAMATWAQISAPLLWVEGALTQLERQWEGRYSRSDFEQRLACVKQVRRALVDGAGHMLHFDQPQALARVIDDFLDDPGFGSVP